MKRGRWTIGLYGKIALTIMAVGLTTFLVRGILMGAETGYVSRPEIDCIVVGTSYKGQLNSTRIADEAKRLGVSHKLYERVGSYNKTIYAPPEQILELLLEILSGKGYKVKFATSNFIILESG